MVYVYNVTTHKITKSLKKKDRYKDKIHFKAIDFNPEKTDWFL